MDPQFFSIMLSILLLGFNSCMGARPLLDPVTGGGTIPHFNPTAAFSEPEPEPELELEPHSAAVLPLVPVAAPDHLPEPELEPHSAAVLPLVPVAAPDHLPEAETQPSVLPPQPGPVWLPEIPNTGKWLPVSNLPSIPFFPIGKINPAMPFMPIPGIPTIPGIPLVPPFPALEQLQGRASMSHPSQQMPFGSSGGYPFQP